MTSKIRKLRSPEIRRTMASGLMTITFVLLGVVVNAQAAAPNQFEFGPELEACVAALHDELDMQGVNRVRHIVTDYDQRGSGYKLKISIRTFSKHAERHYAAICIASGGSEPSALKISEVPS